MSTTFYEGALTHVDANGNEIVLYPNVKTDDSLKIVGKPADAGAVGTALGNLQDDVEEATSIAKGANQGLSYTSYSAMITALNAMNATQLKVGQSIYIGAVQVPDLWVYSVEASSSQYVYNSDDAFVTALKNNVTVQVGYYKLAQLETQKVDLNNYTTKAEFEELEANFSTAANDIGDAIVALGVNVPVGTSLSGMAPIITGFYRGELNGEITGVNESLIVEPGYYSGGTVTANFAGGGDYEVVVGDSGAVNQAPNNTLTAVPVGYIASQSGNIVTAEASQLTISTDIPASILSITGKARHCSTGTGAYYKVSIQTLVGDELIHTHVVNAAHYGEWTDFTYTVNLPAMTAGEYVNFLQGAIHNTDRQSEVQITGMNWSWDWTWDNNPLVSLQASDNNSIVSSFTAYTDSELFKAFDRNDDTYAMAANKTTAVGSHFGFNLGKTVVLRKVKMQYTMASNNISSHTFKLQYLSNGNWVDCDGGATLTITTASTAQSIDISLTTPVECSGFRLYFTGGEQYLYLSGSYGLKILSLQAYGTEGTFNPVYNPLIPVLSADSDSIVSSFTNTHTDSERYKAFDGDDTTNTLAANNTKSADAYFGYDFGKTVTVRRLVLRYSRASTGNKNYGFILQTKNPTTGEWDGYDNNSVTMISAEGVVKGRDIEFLTPVECTGIRLLFTSDSATYLYSSGNYGLKIMTFQALGEE